MTGAEFIAMMKQDIKTEKGDMLDHYKSIVEVMEHVVSQCPGKPVPHTASMTPQDCYSKMESHAEKNKKGNMFAFTPKISIEFIGKYIYGEDAEIPTFVDVGATPTGTGRVNLEDFL